MTLLGYAEDDPTPEQLEPLVRAFVFKSIPGLNTNSTAPAFVLTSIPSLNTNNLEIKIHKMEVKGLWEELQVEAITVECLRNGQWFNGFAGIYHNGKITVIAPTFGGFGLMSGLVSRGKFYYTYSWGSGIHRSHVARLRFENGKLEIEGSGGFQDKDLFVSTDLGGKVNVLSGMFKEFNHWEAASEIGFVGGTNSAGLEIIDANGNVAPTF
ncbi:MAG TPA: hypothetical protein VGJ73_13680 [Verrucomicrobiae bacterium]